MEKRVSTKMIVEAAILVALYVVLSRFCSIRLWNQTWGFSFLAIAVAAIICGPVMAMIVGGMGDFIGAILFPTGQYFPGFTVTAIITGLIFGIFLYRKGVEFKKVNVVVAVIINAIVCTLLLNSLWISMLYTKAWKLVFVSRLIQAGVNVVIQIPIIFALYQIIKKARLIEK